MPRITKLRAIEPTSLPFDGLDDEAAMVLNQLELAAKISGRGAKKSPASAGGAQPAIFIAAGDYDRLQAMADAAARSQPDAAQFLMRELDRASAEAPGPEKDFVGMQSHVRFRDETTGLVRDVQLVYPEEADPAAGRISILTPVGTALIGLSKGQSMRWNDRSGKRKCLTVLEVRKQPAAIA